jgi:hypothetical protein
LWHRETHGDAIPGGGDGVVRYSGEEEFELTIVFSGCSAPVPDSCNWKFYAHRLNLTFYCIKQITFAGTSTKLGSALC